MRGRLDHKFYCKGFSISIIPLAANDEYTRSGNLIFLWSWTPKSFATHAPGSGLISTNALSRKIENFIEFILQCKQANKDAPIRALLSIMTRVSKKGRSFQYLAHVG